MGNSIQITLIGFLLVVISYFIGNISPSTILARASGHNISEEGSGNAGTTNALRVLGKKAAAITLIVDVSKGVIATLMGYYVTMLITKPDAAGDIGLSHCNAISALCGLAVFLGHVFPVLLKFKGGKGVATALGVLLATDWRLALIALGVFIVIVIATRMVSLGSICAAIAFLILYIFKATIGLEALAFLIMVIVLIAKHKDNIKRIIAGEENKISFK